MAIDFATGLKMPKWALVTFGLLSLVAGALALAWPALTILVLVSLLGIHLLIYGVFVVVAAFETGQGRVLGVVFAVLAFIAGTSLFLRPMRNLGSIVVVLSVFWVVGGLMQTIGSIVDRDENWVLELLSGVLSVAAGIVTLVWPGITLLVVAINAGVWMILIGLMRIFAAFRSPTRPMTTATAM